MFKGDFTHLGCNPLDGDEYIAFGNLAVYEPRGDYQFRVKHLMQDGIGNLRLQFDQLKEKLLNEGLFEEERKNSLPTTTRNVAVVTSIRGAALQDFFKHTEEETLDWQSIYFSIFCSRQGRTS